MSKLKQYSLQAIGSESLPCTAENITNGLKMLGIKPRNIHVEGNSFYFRARKISPEEGQSIPVVINNYGGDFALFRHERYKEPIESGF